MLELLPVVQEAYKTDREDYNIRLEAYRIDEREYERERNNYGLLAHIFRVKCPYRSGQGRFENMLLSVY
tara:strand:- start:22576 stop:22782 length:207 start_codon:yes stop_codon:yes gene_type:complete